MSGNDKHEPRKNMLGAPPEKPVIKADEGSDIAQKTSARLAAVQVLYQMQENQQDARSAVQDFIENRVGFDLDGDVFVPPNTDLLREIVIGVEHRDEDVRNIVTMALERGGKSDVENLLRMVLRAGVYELIAHPDIDTGIIINDYLTVTDSFYSGSETKIVNAVLDGVAKQVRQ